MCISFIKHLLLKSRSFHVYLNMFGRLLLSVGSSEELCMLEKNLFSKNLFFSNVCNHNSYNMQKALLSYFLMWSEKQF